jgi:UDP-2,3-diacylglucosamine pyrophosphatase LpxH
MNATPPALFAVPSAGPTEVPDLAEVRLPLGSRAVVVSDLHLPGRATAASRGSAGELARRLVGLEAPAVLVLAGDCFEMLGPDATTVTGALAAHPQLAAALRDFAGRVVVVPGNHDARLAWDRSAAEEVRAVGAGLALAVDIVCETGDGPAPVRVEHGHRFDPANAFADPRNPAETPLGQHIVTDLLPALHHARLDWLDGLAHLGDPADAAAFVGSRLLYRRLARHAGWLLLPVALLALAHAPLLAHVGHASRLSEWLALLALVVVGDVALVAAGLGLAGRRLWAALAGIDLGPRGRAQNDLARAETARLIATGYAGLVTGHTHQCELTGFSGVGADGDPTAFYANCGCGTEVVERRRARFGLPAIFRPVQLAGWVELDAAAVLQVRLYQWRDELPANGSSFLEQVASRRDQAGARSASQAAVSVRPSSTLRGAKPSARAWASSMWTGPSLPYTSERRAKSGASSGRVVPRDRAVTRCWLPISSLNRSRTEPKPATSPQST